MQALLHIRMVKTAFNPLKTPVSSCFVKIAAGSASRADTHHFYAQHFTGNITEGIEFVNASSKFIRRKLKKIIKLQALKEQMEAPSIKPNISERQRQKLNNLIDLVSIKAAYAFGRVSHAIQDARSHIAPLEAVSLDMITGKTKIPPNAYACNFALGTEIAAYFVNLPHTNLFPSSLLKTIYKLYSTKPDKDATVDMFRRSHGLVNLDYPGSLRDMVSIAATGKSDFKRAYKGAVKDTKTFWKKEIIGKIRNKQGKNKTKKLHAVLSEWKPTNKDIFDKWEEIGEKSFEIVASKFQKNKLEGVITDYFMRFLSRYIPCEYIRKKGNESINNFV